MIIMWMCNKYIICIMFFTSFFQIVCAGDERLLQTYGVCDRQRERKLHFGVALAALARHDALCTSIRKIRFILRFRNLLG